MHCLNYRGYIIDFVAGGYEITGASALLYKTIEAAKAAIDDWFK